MSRLAKASFATLLTCASLLAGPVQAQAQASDVRLRRAARPVGPL